MRNILSSAQLISDRLRLVKDPTVQTFGLNTLGWVLVLSPFIAFVIGTIIGAVRRSDENEDAVADLVT